MKILVTGATGFTGQQVLPLLEGKGEIRCFVRPSSNTQKIEEYGYEMASGDLGDLDSLKMAMFGCEGLVNIASMGFGHAPGIVKCAEQAGIRRAIFVSTTAIFTHLNTGSRSVREAAEDCIMHSTLEWTILRPTMIYGTPGDRNMIRLLDFLRRWRVVLIPGNGRRLQQPVHVDDLSRAIVEAFFSSKTINKSYNISGEQPLDLNQIVDFSAKALGIKVYKVHVPFIVARMCIKAYERIVANPRLKEEQILRLNEDKSFDYRQACQDFGYSARSFEEGILQEARLAGYI